MVYEGSGNQPYPTANWSSGVAYSTDLIHWTKYSKNPVLPIHAGFGNDVPEIIVVDNDTWIYYRINGPTQRAKLTAIAS